MQNVRGPFYGKAPVSLLKAAWCIPLLARLSSPRSLIEANKALAVEMDDVARYFGDPDLGFLCNFG
jgi:hypothetical protein